MLTQSHAQESLSQAYMYAVAAAARVLLNVTNVYDYGLDGSFDTIEVLQHPDSHGKIHNLHRPTRRPIYFQLKSTTTWKMSGDEILWSMAATDYIKLVAAGTPVVPAVLILLCLPTEQAEWATFNEESLLLKRCCYYTTVKGDLPAQVDTTRQIRIPRTHVLNEASLRRMLESHSALFPAPAGGG
ncbi:DUF4365 domain-containing protein [Rhizobium sp. 268]|uniref:DUF4365 domain-containing protein n=1 Tax=Rhizobium sp. 268 TaxID=2996375 RepID=UPI002F95B19E